MFCYSASGDGRREEDIGSGMVVETTRVAVKHYVVVKHYALQRSDRRRWRREVVEWIPLLTYG